MRGDAEVKVVRIKHCGVTHRYQYKDGQVAACGDAQWDHCAVLAVPGAKGKELTKGTSDKKEEDLDLQN